MKRRVSVLEHTAARCARSAAEQKAMVRRLAQQLAHDHGEHGGDIRYWIGRAKTDVLKHFTFDTNINSIIQQYDENGEGKAAEAVPSPKSLNALSIASAQKSVASTPLTAPIRAKNKPSLSRRHELGTKSLDARGLESCKLNGLNESDGTKVRRLEEQLQVLQADCKRERRKAEDWEARVRSGSLASF